ncbi:MAG TPA: hypothetical protein VL992_11730 [Tepidisphaeraceae bacterium]|nr:hypothetical protein [Tepidisphaeraceae bacterium]
MFNVPNGKPGVLLNLTATPREVFYSGREHAQFIAAPVTVDGNLTSCPFNAPYVFEILAGTLMGRVTATNKFSNSVIGLTGAATASGATTVQTDVNTAAEIVRRIGASGTFILTGPPTAGGTVASQTVTYSAVNTTTGAITCTATSAAAVTASLIQPTDGSQTILTMVADLYGIKVTDQTNVNRVDVFDPKLLLAGGTINSQMIVNYPADPSLETYVKAALKAFSGNLTFSDDILG